MYNAIHANRGSGSGGGSRCEYVEISCRTSGRVTVISSLPSSLDSNTCSKRHRHQNICIYFKCYLFQSDLSPFCSLRAPQHCMQMPFGFFLTMVEKKSSEFQYRALFQNHHDLIAKFNRILPLNRNQITFNLDARQNMWRQFK